MQNKRPIELAVRDGALPAPWRHVQASNHKIYSFRFDGGSDGNGSIESVVGKGRVEAKVILVADKHYEIEDCRFENDPRGQLDRKGRGRAVVILDTNTEPLQAKYIVQIKDTRDGATLDCHPPVINRIA